MKIGMYLSHFPSPGGTTSAVKGLAQGLASRGHEVEIMCQGVDADTWQDGDVLVRRFKRPRGGVPFVVSQELVKFFRHHGHSYDLCVLNGLFHRDMPVLARAIKSAKIPYVMCPHSPVHPELMKRKRIAKLLYWHLIEKQILSDAAGVQVLARRDMSLLVERGVNARMFVVANGFEFTSVDNSRAAGLIEGKVEQGQIPVVGILGRVDAVVKGLDLAIEALAQLFRRGIFIRLVIQGDDWGDAKRLKTLAIRLNVDQFVEFRPRTAQPLLAIRGFHILLVASRWDGFNLTALEALASGVPVVCSAEAGVSEYVAASGGGVVVRPTVDELAEGMAKVLRDFGDYHRAASESREWVRQNLSWGAVSAAAEGHYQRIVDDGTGGSGRRVEGLARGRVN